MNRNLTLLKIDKFIFSSFSDAIYIEDEDVVAYIKKGIEVNETMIFAPNVPDSPRIGTEVKIVQVLSPSQNFAQVLVETVGLVEYSFIEKMDDIAAYTAYNVRPVTYSEAVEPSVLALGEKLIAEYNEYEELVGAPPADLGADLNENVNTIAARIKCSEEKIYFSTNTEERLLTICADLQMLLEIQKMEERVNEKVQDAMDQNQREYYVREQIKAFNEELGEEDETNAFALQIDKMNAPDDIKDKLKKDVKRLARMPSNSPESAIMKNYLEFCLELPWNYCTDDNSSLENARKVLDEDHYGIKKVKERLIEALAVRKLSPNSKSPIICLYGPPGVGKTSIAMSIARAMNKKYVRLSFGGIRDEAEIRGHRKTYVGAMPGRIITSIHQAGSSNPVFLMDEIDKMAADYKGDPASALLEVLDPEQNKNFRDHYLELPFDLSQVLFITTANSLDPISAPLLDRMELIEMSGYTHLEKFHIAKRHLIKKVVAENGLKPEWVQISDSALETVIEEYTRESGVRGLSKELSAIMRKVATVFADDPDHAPIRVTKNNLEKYLGKPKYLPDDAQKEDAVGVANGLAWTSVGGTMLTIEATLVPNGKGEAVLTGRLGDVMKESARTALSFVKTVAADYGIDLSPLKDHDVHIHVPEGATPKDGPSAGITIASAIMSALSGKSIKHNVAMTGEITLRGKVLPIGGLKEKSLAALRQGISDMIIPAENKRDYDELPSVVKNKMKFNFVRHWREVAPIVFGERI